MLCFLFSFVKIVVFLLSSQSWAELLNQEPVVKAVSVGSKHLLRKSTSYHFSSRKLVSVHSSEQPPFIIGLEIGDLLFKENSTPKRLLILNSEQLSFFNNVNFIIESSPFLIWKVQGGRLKVSGSVSENEFKVLLSACASKKVKTIILDVDTNSEDQQFFSENEKNCLGLNEVFSIDLAILNEDSLSGRRTGLGVPSELSWAVSPGFKFSNLEGAITAGLQKGAALGHSFFNALLEEDTPLVFESGSEILIKPPGSFSRQKNEWKKAVSNIELKILEKENSHLKLQIKINKTERTAESQIYNVEKFEQIKTLKLNLWEKLFVFRQKSKSSNKSGFLGLSFLGHKGRSENRSSKQLWVRVSSHD